MIYDLRFTIYCLRFTIHDFTLTPPDAAHPPSTHQDYFVEVDVVMPAHTELWRAHDLAQRLQDQIERLPGVERAFVHVDHETEHRPVRAWRGHSARFLAGLIVLLLLLLSCRSIGSTSESCARACG
jgi:Dimerisation domain of Zinc Transporter